MDTVGKNAKKIQEYIITYLNGSLCALHSIGICSIILWNMTMVFALRRRLETGKS